MIGLQKGTGPRVQTTAWLHHLAFSQHLGSRWNPAVQLWAGSQGVLVLPLVFEKCWVTFWKMPSNYWGWEEYNLKKKSTKREFGSKRKAGATGYFLIPSRHSTNVLLPSARNLTPHRAWEAGLGLVAGTSLWERTQNIPGPSTSLFLRAHLGLSVPFLYKDFLKSGVFLGSQSPVAWFNHTEIMLFLSKHALGPRRQAG